MAKAGRPKGSKNARKALPAELTAEALLQLEKSVKAGKSWAVQFVVEQAYPRFKPITDPNSLDGQLIRAKIFEVQELQQRLDELDKKLAEMKK